MGIVSLPKRKVQQAKQAIESQIEAPDLVRLTAGGALVAGGILLLTGQRRTGIAVSVAGAALTLLGEQETVRTWWEQVPDYVSHLENMVGRVKSSMEEMNVTRDNLRQVLTGTGR
jgi:hypothetical protein